MIAEHIPVNKRLCDVLGIKERLVHSFTLRAEAGEMPTLTLTRSLTRDSIAAVDQVFELILKQPATPTPPPFDLDRMVGEATDRLSQALDRAVSSHLLAMAIRSAAVGFDYGKAVSGVAQPAHLHSFGSKLFSMESPV